MIELLEDRISCGGVTEYYKILGVLGQISEGPNLAFCMEGKEIYAIHPVQGHPISGALGQGGTPGFRDYVPVATYSQADGVVFDMRKELKHYRNLMRNAVKPIL